MLLVACTASVADSATESSRTDTAADSGVAAADTGADSAPLPGWDTASTYVPGGSGYTAEQVGEAIDSALQDGLPDPWSLLDSVDGMAQKGDPNSCPTGHGRNYNSGMAGCEASTGWIFGGLTIFESASDGSSGYTLTGDAWALDPSDGGRWVGAGESEFLDYRTEGFEFAVAGTWGSAWDRNWTGGQPSVGMTLVGTPTTLSVDGGLSANGATVYFEGFVYDTSLGLSGAILARDPEGPWYRLELGDDGDNCGDVTLDGVSLGTACPGVDARARDTRNRMGLGG